MPKVGAVHDLQRTLGGGGQHAVAPMVNGMTVGTVTVRLESSALTVTVVVLFVAAKAAAGVPIAVASIAAAMIPARLFLNLGMSCPFLPIGGVYPLAGPSREITAIQMR